MAYALTAVVGAPLGARLIAFVDPKQLRQLFGLLLLSLSVGSLTRKTPLEMVGNVFLVVGLLSLVVGTLWIAFKQQRAADVKLQEAGR